MEKIEENKKNSVIFFIALSVILLVMFFTVTIQAESLVRSSSLQTKVIENGNIERVDYVDENGNITYAANKGYATIIKTKTDHAQLDEYYDEKGKPVCQALGHYAILREYDADGREYKITYLGSDKKPILIRSGYSVALRTFDKNGRVIKELYLDREERPILTKSLGYGCLKEYDENGRNIKITYIDINGNPMISGQGFAILSREYYDSGENIGRVKNEFYFDENGVPICLSLKQYGCYKEYDELGRLSEITYLDANGNPLETNEGYAIVRYLWNNDDSVLAKYYYDVSGKPVSLSEGQYAVMIMDGNEIYLDADGNRVFNLRNFLYSSKLWVILFGLITILVSVFNGRKVNFILLVLYLYFIVYMTLLHRNNVIVYYNFELFWSYKQFFTDPELAWEILSNLFLFIPLGTILYRILPSKSILLVPVGISVMVEVIQFLTHTGLCEFDDVISNGIGGVLGYVIGRELCDTKKCFLFAAFCSEKYIKESKFQDKIELAQNQKIKDLLKYYKKESENIPDDRYADMDLLKGSRLEHKMKKKLEYWRIMAFFLALYDAVTIAVAYFLALMVRFDFQYTDIPTIYLDVYKKYILFYVIFCIILFWILKLYRSIWRFASANELAKVTIASMISTVVHIVGSSVVIRFFENSEVDRMPISYFLVGALLLFFFVMLARFSYRFIILLRENLGVGEGNAPAVGNIMIIGAGNAGQMLVRDIHMASEVKGRVRCIIDDDKNKHGRFLEGVPIVGGRDKILSAVQDYKINRIYIAIPSASMQERKEILEICGKTDCRIKNLPGMYQLVKGDVTVSQMRNVSVEDLLGREPVKTDLQEVMDFIQGKVVLVTGGGGSIGSELCRQIAGHNPKQLIIMDIYENSTYEVQLELKEKYPDLNLVVQICSVRDSRKIFQLFEEFHPQIVYHAAAHKHVPLMETVPCEVIKNNTIGTYKTAFAALAHGCERFVLISTDKAVNPTNIMGASKRLCEMIIQSFDIKIKEGKAEEIPQLFTHRMDSFDHSLTSETLSNAKTEFVAVRFGNVLGSNGSVIPIFKHQIEKGGPVTVTHPDIIRYFMTIPEAVSLVLLAGTYAKGGEIFVLDMGSPVKIDTLARNLIRMSGFKPDIDIKIEYTGLRPGEKLYEEKLMAEEGLKTTENKLIFIGCPIPFNVDEFLVELKGLMDCAYNNKRDIRERVKKVVSTYHPEDGAKG